MSEKFKFTRVEIAPLEEFLKLTSEERLEENNRLANRLIELEKFMEKFIRGYNFINSKHGYTC